MVNIEGLSQLRKEVCMHEWTSIEYSGLLFKFIAEGTLEIMGEDKSRPIIHKYSLSHKENKFFIDISPNLFNEPEVMEIKVMANHITLQGLNNEKNIIHLTRLKLKAY